MMMIVEKLCAVDRYVCDTTLPIRCWYVFLTKKQVYISYGSVDNRREEVEKNKVTSRPELEMKLELMKGKRNTVK